MAGKVIPRRLPTPRTALGYDGEDFRALKVNLDGELQNASLDLLAVLWNCLRSVGTDRFMVKGEDQLFSYKDRYAERVVDLDPAGPWISLPGTPVPPGEVWFVQAMRGVDATGIPTLVELRVGGAGVTASLTIATPTAAAESILWSGEIVMAEGDVASARFDGFTAGDGLYLDIWGLKMTKE